MEELILQNGLYTLDSNFLFHKSYNSYYIEKEYGYCVFHMISDSEDVDFSILDKKGNVITHIPWINKIVTRDNWEDFIGRNATSH
ncbi:hypothetical protein ATO12_17105 [Aquimarina atlantica]|uniref:Uncharacterized protein n=1 Tax=Aquimarina atlantica TaxID=1317122 RepID=A0A023BUN8_9FLAO|nr:hypothetical protein [Aquimarina atlantica]EZH73654.1 hypothetical protein ATO12_17105 [Aquimarina atlantica]